MKNDKAKGSVADALAKLTPEQEREFSEAAKLTCAWETTCQTEEEE